jgi:filamentous hemagglutinin family protein
MKTPVFDSRLSFWFVVLAYGLEPLPLQANPTGLNVTSGSASISVAGSQLNVTVGQTAILNWSSFNIGVGETTTFLQPSVNSVVFNVIGGANPSQIYGHLNASGTVILANANGFYFGPDSMIKVGGSFIATTAPLPPDLGFGGTWQFTGMPPLARIVNYGQIEVGKGKSLYLIAENIENHGNLNAPEGDVELAAGSEVLVSESADGRGLSASVKLPSGSVDNFGRITADAGTIALEARVVNQNGILQADSLAEKNGVIELVASDTLSLGADSKILARGDDSVGGSGGGVVTLKSDSFFADAEGSQIVTTGGTLGGNGGNIEVSAPNIQSLNSAMDAGAQAGSVAGEFLLDPVNIVLGTSGGGAVSADGSTIYSTAGTLNLNVNTAFLNKNFSNIKLEASGNITLNSSVTWNLSASTGLTSGQLTLLAGSDIIFNNGAKITDSGNWSVTLEAGYNFVQNSVVAGTGNIYLNGGSGKSLNGTIQLAAGAVNLLAGQSILVGTGSVYTMAGGSIYAQALAGDINCGTANGGYQFTIYGYSPVAVLGGMSTAAGGDVTLIAGNNITSIPTTPSGQNPGASGAYGTGNVTLVAGNFVLGNYTLENGAGSIFAGAHLAAGSPVIDNTAATVGTLQRPVSLSLVKGAWDVYSGGDIFISEVRNPNGTFNAQKRLVTGSFAGNEDATEAPSQTTFAFDYTANAAANFWAGNAIELVGANLPRVTGQNQAMSPIYAPILSLNAGAGGIKIDNSIILYPSLQGALSITTRDGGSLVGAVQASGLTTITMSDSGLPGWATFLLGHAVTPLHLHDDQPVTLNISGNLESLALTVPTYAQIVIGGNTYNFGFSGRNLLSAQTTSIQMAGDITYRGNLTSVTLTEPLPATLLSSPGDAAVLGRLIYADGKLTYVGVMSDAILQFLLNPTVLVYDNYGQPVLNADGTQQTVAVTLTDSQKAAIQSLCIASQNATLGDQGLALAGPGTFQVEAHTIDLGISGGISVTAPDAVLAAVSPYGAKLSVTTHGNLSLTSSEIANESYRGGILLEVGGQLDVGGQFTTFGDANAPKGIFTTSGGSISIRAQGDVNVNSSRVAAYNGGNIYIKSLLGDINAGDGGAGYVSMNALELNSAGQLTSLPASIPGSGILATTLFGSHAGLGNITIEASVGSVNASLGGVLQIAFNGADSRNNYIAISAGQDINASGSGIIGSNIRLQALGNITGVIVGSQGISIDSQHNVDVTAISGGGVDVSAGGSITGTIVGGGSVNVSGEAVDAAVLGSSVSASGDTTGASLGVPTSNVAKDTPPAADNASEVTAKTGNSEEDPLRKKKGIVLAQKVSRVTVLLPVKN